MASRMKAQAENPALKGALEAATLGLEVALLHWPEERNQPGGCSCGKPDCESPGKHPLEEGWQETATSDAAEIRRRFKNHSKANYGIIMGKGIGVLDEDIPHAAVELEREYGPLPDTLAVRTSRGSHRYFLGDFLTKTGFRTGLDTKGINLNGTVSLAVGPGSLHASGKRYEWVNWGTPIAASSEWLVKLLRNGKDGSRSPAPPVEGEIPEGKRNSTLLSLAGTMQRRGMAPGAIEAALLEENQCKCRPPLGKREVQAIARGVLRYELGPEGSDPLHFTDIGNARRLIALHGNRLRYCERLGGWLVWDGKRWAKDQWKRVQLWAKDVPRQALREAAETEDEERRKRLFSLAMRSGSEARIRAMISLAASEPEVASSPEDFDQQPWMFNVLNGTLDLRTGELKDHDPSYKITRLAPVRFDPDAKAPRWRQFLREVLRDPDVQGFLQRGVGLSMIGEVREHVILMPYGTGANGKGAFFAPVQSLFGDYGNQSDPELLLVRRNDAHPTGVADLFGARMVVTTEVQDGRRLAEALVKQLTGGDRVKARFLHRDFFEFEPTWTIWLVTNHKPQILGTDEGIWRRIRLVPFDVTIPLEQQDRGLPGKLKEELSGILNWALEGCLEYQRVGLQEPEAVMAATSEYEAESDVLGSFLDDETELAKGHYVESSALYLRFREWCESSGEREVSHRQFGQAMVERGFEKDNHPTNRRARYLGLQLRPKPVTPRSPGGGVF